MPSRLLIIPSLLALVLACDSQPSQPAVKAAPVVEPAPTPGADAVKASETERHYNSALELEAAGRLVEARAEVELALAGGAGRDAQLLAAKLAILRDDLDVAANLLEPLAVDGRDALVLYNLGLIAQRRGAYNPARSRYLAALKADPNYAPARYNLALLTADAGIKDEAQHHALKFIELSPGDPRAAELRVRVGLDALPPPAGPTPTDTVTSPAVPTTPEPTKKDKPKAPKPGTDDSGLKDPFEKR
jgi:tetratricopeptide (TPR) repeat protein